MDIWTNILTDRDKKQWFNQGILKGKYHCTIDLLFDWFGINRFYLQNRLIQTSQTGGQWYSDTSRFSIPWFNGQTDIWMEWRTDGRTNGPTGRRLDRLFRLFSILFEIKFLFNSEFLQCLPTLVKSAKLQTLARPVAKVIKLFQGRSDQARSCDKRSSLTLIRTKIVCFIAPRCERYKTVFLHRRQWQKGQVS